jgi:DNA polymerase-1
MTDWTIPTFGVTLPFGSMSYKIEQAIRPIEEEMASVRLHINPLTFERNRRDADQEYKELLKQCRAATGNPNFRPNATADCRAELFDKRGLSPRRTTPGGQSSVGEGVLQALRGEDPFVELLIKARVAHSRLTQMEAWRPYADAGHVQTNWKSLGQPMGRFTTDTPNLLNRIPEIRETIEPQDGWRFVGVDVNMSEYHSWASLSGDPFLTDAFTKGIDLHQATYDESMAKTGYSHDEPRQAGKTLNFSMLYLMTPPVLAERLGTDNEQATEFMRRHQGKLRVGVAYIESLLKEARKNGHTATFFGRRREFEELRNTQNRSRLHSVQKTAWHHVNCGTAAEIVKIKQIQVTKELGRRMPTTFRNVINHFDEFILEIQEGSLEEAKQTITEVMERPIKGLLPLRFDLAIGRNWREISP